MGSRVKSQIKDVHARVTPDEHIGLVLLGMLKSYHYLLCERPDSDNAHGNMKLIHFIELLHDDIALRLCNLAEDKSRSWGFAQAFKKLRKRSNIDLDEDRISRKIKEYRELIRPIRERRDNRIAHYSKRDPSYWRPADIRTAIQMAVEIGDLLARETVEYHLLGLDLRANIVD